MLLLSTLLVLGSPQGIELPDSPAARAWAGVGPETAPVVLASALFEDDPWLIDVAGATPPLPWLRWGEWLRAEGLAREIDPRRRAGLLMIAAGQQRWGNAWAHFERLGAAPAWAAAMLPRLLPGAPANHPAGPGGFPHKLPDGVLLTPAIPPRIAGDPPTSLRPRKAAIRGLRIGAAVIDLTISIEPSGVQVDLLHVRGEAVTVNVLLPEPPGQEIRVEYIDWMRQDQLRAPMRVVLAPGDDEHSLFGRFRTSSLSMPRMPRQRLPEGLWRGGLWIEGPAGGELERLARPLARALGKLFGFPTGFVPRGGRRPEETWSATVLHVGEGSAGLARLIEIISLAERYVLAGGLR